MHRLITIEAILNTLVILNDAQPLSEELQNMYVFVFKKVIEETKTCLKSRN